MTSSWIGIGVYALAMGLLGYVIPSRMGFDFLDPVNTVAYSALAPVFAAARIGPSRHAIWTATLFGFVSILLALILALVTVNQRYPFGKLLMPDPAVLLSALAFALAASYFAAVVGARLLARGWSALSAKAALRRSVLLLFLALLLSARFVPDRWKASLGSLLTDQGIVYLLLGAAILLGAIALILDRRSSTSARTG